MKSKAVYYWLLTGCFLIACMVVVGGITRLTQSGLSIVEWKPLVGIIPPLNEAEWIQEFNKYKTSPEFKTFNAHFHLEDFKAIYFWEYLHRLLGRLLGFIFLFPAVYFWLNKSLNGTMKKRLTVIFFGGVLQGFLGWYMVKSGLIKNPHVSHYRLAAHLTLALTLMGYIYWTALVFKYGNIPRNKKLFSNRFLNVFFILTSIQIIYGAFVAGLKAGKMYNTFPKMGSVWIPVEWSYAFERLGLLALTEGHVVVQFIHRLLGMILFSMASYLAFQIKFMDRKIWPASRWVVVLFIIQVGLGILTLIYAVPITLGVLHQAVAMGLCLALLHLKFKSQVRSDLAWGHS